MNRRTYLSVIGASSVSALMALAGCASDGEGGGTGGGGGGGDGGGSDGGATEAVTETATVTQTETTAGTPTGNMTGTTAGNMTGTTAGNMTGTTAGNMTGTTAGQQATTDFKFGGKVSGWRGPHSYQGKKNPTITLQPGTQYTVKWKNLDGQPHDFVLRDSSGNEIAGTDIVSEKGAVITFTFTATAAMAEYICTVHPTTMVGTVQIKNG